jgi:hypothetical protein
MSDPKPAFDTGNNLCALGMTPHIVTGFLRDWLTNRFSDADNIETEQLRGMLWTATQPTGILIESITRWKPEATEKRPAIIIKRGSWTSSRLVLNDSAGIGDVYLGSQRYGRLMTGSHTLFCISNSGAQSEIISGEVFKDLNTYGLVIANILNLVKFEAVELGELFQLEEAKENYAAPIVIQYTGQEVWTVAQQGPILKRVNLSSYLP